MASNRKTAAVRNEPVWTAGMVMPSFPPLAKNLSADVCIVGAGIAGLTTAYLLARRGKSVVVLDDGPIAGGMTAVTSAHLSNAVDDRYFEIERLHGEQGARLACESHTAAIDCIADIVRAERIDCDFQRTDGYLFLAPEDQPQLLEREFAAAQRSGTRVEKISRAPLNDFDTGPCLRFPDQAQFHPLKYLSRVAKAVVRDGGQIYSGSHADQIKGGKPARITVGSHEVKAGAVVVATNSPVNDRVAIHTKQTPWMTYVIAARIPTGSLPLALFWDTMESYHYIRVQPGTNAQAGDLLLIGGEDHKTGRASDMKERHSRLEVWARHRFPQMGKIEFAWSGQVMETIDGLAFIGRNPMDKDNVFIVTGDSGMGLTHGTIAGMLLTDLIMGRANPWQTLYDPSRKSLRALGTYTREAIGTVVQYDDWLTVGDVKSVREIPNGSGAVLRRGLKKVAVYRDDEGKLHQRSAVCPHLGGIVHWNSVEQTWDCPCHGSRFKKLGEVMVGPANAPLAQIGKKTRTGKI